MVKAIGLHREATLAGKHEADMAICSLVGERLKEKGFDVEMIEPENFREGLETELIFSMARTKQMHEILQTYVERGVFVINNPKAVADSLNREISYKRLRGAGARIPKTMLVELNELSIGSFPGKCVLKRPDRHGFTTIVENEKQLKEAIKSYGKQGVNEIIVQEFVEGEHVKFYAIGGEIFLMNPNEIAVETRESVEEQGVIAGNAAGLKIYGGDFVVTKRKTGKAYLVDVNDWPSFSPIRQKAAEKIAELIKREFKQF